MESGKEKYENMNEFVEEILAMIKSNNNLQEDDSDDENLSFDNLSAQSKI